MLLLITWALDFLFVVGTVGALENESIGFGQFFAQIGIAIIVAAVSFFATIIYDRRNAK